MFNSFNYSKTRLARLNDLPLETKAAILAQNPCTIFEYNIRKDIQGKTAERKEYTGRILAVGISYNSKTKEHECKIEQL